MNLFGKLFQLLATTAILGCIATVTLQVAGAGVLWSRGALTSDKVLRYTGILYGLDPFDVARDLDDERQIDHRDSREEILADRVKKTPQLAERADTISQHVDDIRAVTLTLKRNREKFVTARDGFESLLNQLESETVNSAFRELQVTLEVATPKQSKEILHTMLNTPPVDPADNVMRDVVRVVKALPDAKLRKILAEFKTEEERKMLHRILVEIGELDQRSSQLSRAQP